MREASTAGSGRSAAGAGDHERASDTRRDDQLIIRRADPGDVDGVAGLAGELAQSFTFSRTRFQLAYPACSPTTAPACSWRCKDRSAGGTSSASKPRQG